MFYVWNRRYIRGYDLPLVGLFGSQDTSVDGLISSPYALQGVPE